MPALSDYTSGTITLTNGSTAFTGSGTGWQAADFREGDVIFQVAGQTQWTAVVQSITSNTSGTLVRPWGGATGTYQYRMRYMADGARVTAQARNLIELLGNGNLQAEASLTGVANTLSYFTGPAAKALTPLTAFARTLLDDANAAAARDTLDVAQKQSSLTDATAGRAMLVGAFGLGSADIPISTFAHVDDIPATGVYYVNNVIPGLPESIVSHVINIRQDASSGRHWQLCKPVGSHNFYTRYCFNGVWSAWQRIMYRSDILGTVSQTGGVPTGAIMEGGTNTNGSYVRFAGGTQICAGPGGGILGGETWTFPAAFIATPAVSGNTQSNAFRVLILSSNSPTSVTLRVVDAANTPITNSGAFPMAIGRWF